MVGLELIEGNLMLFKFFMLFSTTILTIFVEESWQHFVLVLVDKSLFISPNNVRFNDKKCLFTLIRFNVLHKTPRCCAEAFLW